MAILLIPGATEETGGRWLIKLFHKPSNSNSMFPLSGSELAMDEWAETLDRPPMSVAGGISGGLMPLILASSDTPGACVDNMPSSGIFGIDGGVNNPGSDPFIDCEVFRLCMLVLIASPGCACSEAGPWRGA
jgi:hypothetical protein